jgi:predicted transport protein
MPLFQVDGQQLKSVAQRNFTSEKVLQALVERSLETVFGCRFVATEFPTGDKHGGRIDTLALSEDGNPVIIEYKKEPSSDLINQSLFYLSWIHDHRGDFQVVAMKALGKEVDIDWSDVRVICIAPSYRKYDLHAVTMMGANIELWQYHHFANGALYLEEVFRKTLSPPGGTAGGQAGANGKNPVMVEAGRKAAITRATGSYTIEQHLERGSEETRALFEAIRQKLLALDDSVEEAPKKLYIAYKVAQNFLCMEIHKKHLLLYLKLSPDAVKPMPQNGRDVRGVGHYGTGDLELRVCTSAEAEAAMPLIAKALEGIGD